MYALTVKIVVFWVTDHLWEAVVKKKFDPIASTFN